jgi:hypothetical protein
MAGVLPGATRRKLVDDFDAMQPSRSSCQLPIIILVAAGCRHFRTASGPQEKANDCFVEVWGWELRGDAEKFCPWTSHRVTVASPEDRV